MTFFGATTLMTVNLIEVTFYICALFTSAPGMTEVGIRLIDSVQHLYFIVSAPAVFLPLGTVLIKSRLIPNGWLFGSRTRRDIRCSRNCILAYTRVARIRYVTWKYSGGVVAGSRVFTPVPQSKNRSP